MTIGHGALITSATIGNRVLVGQGSIIQEGAEIGNNVVIAAGAVVLPGTSFSARIAASFLAPMHIIIIIFVINCICVLMYSIPFDLCSGTIVPSNQLWAGNPAVYIREITDEECAGIKNVTTFVNMLYVILFVIVIVGAFFEQLFLLICTCFLSI